MTTYERIRIKKTATQPGRTLYLENPSEGSFKGIPVLSGENINKESEPISQKGPTIEIIQLSIIAKRTEVFYNGRYGTLENEPWKP